ncbi:MAG: tetratricopeptide repeat protein [Phycisphaerales bacterium]
MPTAPAPGNGWRILTALAALCLLAGISALVLIRAFTSGSVTLPPGTPPPPAPQAARDSRAASGTIADALREARIALDRGQNQPAAAILSRAVERWPKDQELRLRLGEALIALKDFASAYPHYRAAIDIGPAPANLHLDAGTVANAAGLPDEAMAHYLLARKADPANPRIPLYLGMVHARRGDDAAATASLLTAIGLDPSLAEAWGTLAELSLRNDRLGMAADQARKARELQPTELRWRLVEARALKRDNKPDQAAMLLVGLDAANRAQPAVLELLADCYGMLGKPAQAAAACEEAAKTRPADGTVAYLAALWLDRAGKREDAERFARRADELGEPRAVALLQQLRGK